MYEIMPEIWKLMNRLMTSIFLLTTNLSWWLMKQEKVLTVLTVSNFIEFDLFRVDSIFLQKQVLRNDQSSIGTHSCSQIPITSSFDDEGTQLIKKFHFE